MKKKGFLDISFSWIFAVLVGGLILFGAIYGLNKFSKTQENFSGAENAKSFSNFLNPLENDIESGKIITLTFPVESRLNNICRETSSFGQQGFAINEKVNNEWTKTNPKVYSENQYVFSESIVQGKILYAFSMPLEIPFKVADLIYLIPQGDKYCFIDMDREIEDDLDKLNNPNLLTDNCENLPDVIKVCFEGGNDCDIEVEYNLNFLTKGTEKISFTTDALMYGAIFSDSKIYECQIGRIIYRANILATMYKEKGLDLTVRGCTSPIIPELSQYAEDMMQVENSSDLYLLDGNREIIERYNRYSSCKLW